MSSPIIGEKRTQEKVEVLGRRSDSPQSEGIDSEGSEKEVEITVPGSATEFPDGGLRAWLVVVGAVCNNAGTYGLINSWGVFQAYYETNTLASVSPSTIAWIGSVQYALVFLPGLVVGRMFDLGYHKIPLLVATIFFILATFLTAECTKYWQFLLCQGFVVGLSCGTIFGPTIATISHWFKKKLGLVLGIAAVGSSLGGTLFPIIARSLIPIVGFKWTMRIIGFILIFILGIGNVVGLPDGFVFHPRLTILTHLIGLITGALNLMIPMTAIAGVLTYAWPFATNQGSLIAIAVLYGFASGTYISLLVLPIMSMGDSGDIGRRLGMFMSIIAIGAVSGPPISGAIEAATSGYHVVGYYAGSTIMVSIALMTIVRYMLLGGVWGKI